MTRAYFKYIPWGVLCLGFVLTLLFSVYCYKLTQNNRVSRFHAIAKEVDLAIQARLKDYVDGLYGGVGLFDASDYVSRAEWQNYISSTWLGKRFPGILGMGYIEVVRSENRNAFLKEVRKDGDLNYQIHPAGKRPYYYLVKYVEPNKTNQSIVGYDMNVEDVRHIALVDARDSGKPTLTSRVFLNQQEKKEPGFLLFVPYYKRGSDTSSIAQREINLQGWIFGRFSAKAFFDGLMRRELPQLIPQVFVTVYSKNEKGKEAFLFSNQSLVFGAHSDKNLTSHFSVKSLGTTWVVKLKAAPGFFEATDTIRPFWVLISGFVISVFLFAISYLVIYLQRHAAQLANRMTVRLREQKISLERENEELGHLIYNTTYDIKEPLHDVHSIVEWIEEDLEGQLPPKLFENVVKIKGRIYRLTQSLDRLREFSRVKLVAQELHAEKVDIRKLVERVYSDLPNPNQVKLILSEAKFPIIKTHLLLLRSVLEHLIKNALQYSQESGGELHILAVEEADFVIFELKDNGVGVSKEQIDLLFEVDETLRGQYTGFSSGMGLLIAKKVVETYGGIIKMVNNELGGVSCYFTWPVEIPSDLFNGFN